MRTVRRLIEAKKVEREENGEAGFSLIELIIVVVILGILVAVAFPIIGNLQASAEKAAADAAASNLATEMAADIAETGSATLPTGAYQGYSIDATSSSVASLDVLCVKVFVKGTSGDTSEGAGPGCTP